MVGGGAATTTKMSVPLWPNKATVKMEQYIDSFGGYNFKAIYAAVGFNIGIPASWWPAAFTAKPQLWVNVGTEGTSGTTASVNALDGTLHTYGRTGSPYACIAVDVKEIGSSGYGKLTWNDASSSWPVLDHAKTSLTGKMDVVVSKKAFGTEEDMKVQTRYVWNKGDNQLTMDGFTNAPVKWKVPALNADLELNVQASYDGPADSFTGSTLSLRVKGCGFGKLPFNIGSSRPQFLAQADFTGSKKDGFVWQVGAGLSNIAIGDVVKDVSILVQYGTAGLEITGTAKAELNLQGVTKKPVAVVQLEQKGQAEGQGRAQIPNHSFVLGLPEGGGEGRVRLARLPKAHRRG
jgi:hypothetical protein